MGKTGVGASTGLFSRRGRKQSSGGFTLLELVMTVAIVGILAAVAIPLYVNYLEKARLGRAIAELRYFAEAIDAWEIIVGVLPGTLDEVSMRANQPDPWGYPYVYVKLAGAGGGGGGGGKGKGGGGGGKARKYKGGDINADYDLYSIGKGGKTNSPLTSKHSNDDVVRADDGDFFGLVSDYIGITK